jgi:uncharacterized Fe-S cluster-containing radical SAM superfamily protein
MVKTDSLKRASELRKTLISPDGSRILVVDFTDTLQGKDTSKVIDLMPNVKTGDYVFRAKINVKEIDPLARAVYARDYFDVSAKTDEEIEGFIRKRDFDFPLWFKHDADFSMKRVQDYNTPFIMQVGGCNFHDGSKAGGCWYCFVDDKSNDGLPSGKATLSSEETIDSMISARGKIRDAYRGAGSDVNLRVLRVSGGEPTIVLDWILNMWRKISERGLDFRGQLDTNLSTGALVDFFEREGIYEPHILEKLAEHPIKFLTALKGSDNENLQSNVQSTATIEAQKYSIRRILKAGFDIYPQLYNPNPKTLASFLSEMDSEIDNFSLRVHIGPLKMYGPTRLRLELEAERLGVNAEEFVKSKEAEWSTNYEQSCEIMEGYLRERHGVGYKQLTRSDVKLALKN